MARLVSQTTAKCVLSALGSAAYTSSWWYAAKAGGGIVIIPVIITYALSIFVVCFLVRDSYNSE